MGLTESMFSVDNQNFSNVTITVEDRYPKIEPIDVTVTIVVNNDSVQYDGQQHTVTGYEVTNISSTLYTVNDFRFTGTVTASGTDAGNYA